MRRIGYLSLVLLAGAAPTGGAAAANVCHAETLFCATTMPIDGYCECTAHGRTKDGTVITSAQARALRRSVNSTAGGCGAEPSAPGCRP
jgi:hypothetical protein